MISPPSRAIRDIMDTAADSMPDTVMIANAPMACRPRPRARFDGLPAALGPMAFAGPLRLLLQNPPSFRPAVTLGLVPMLLLQTSSLSHPYSASHFDGVILTYITIITICKHVIFVCLLCIKGTRGKKRPGGTSTYAMDHRNGPYHPFEGRGSNDSNDRGGILDPGSEKVPRVGDGRAMIETRG
jgi:hypothetical protein